MSEITEQAALADIRARLPDGDIQVGGRDPGEILDQKHVRHILAERHLTIGA